MASQDAEKDLAQIDVSPVNDDRYDVTSDAAVWDAAAERALTRKLDLHILPFATLMYLFNSLDRSNYSNAKTDGMITDLHFPTDGYSHILTIFYVVFSAGGVPGMIVTRKFGAHITLPAFMLGFGAMSMINSACSNFASSAVVRTLIALFEAGFAPSLIFYLTTFYKRDELARRVACFYSCLALAGAFSGLLAYGVFQIETGILKGWQYLFLIEGGATIIVASTAIFFLPKSPAEAKFLSQDLKRIAELRLLQDSSSDINAEFKYRAFFSPLLEVRFWLFAVIAVSYGTASSVASNFLSIIIQRFGYSTVKTNLWSVAPNFFSAACMGVSCWLSDRYRVRSWWLLSALTMTCTGCIVLAALPVTEHAAGYFACFLIAGGAFTPSVLFHTWHQNNDVNLDSRGFRVAALTTFANSGGIVSANIFLTKFSPKYTIPLIITAALELVAICIVFGVRMKWARINRLRNQQQNVSWSSKDVPTEALAAGPADPRFRYFL